jgi:hypothetical protein
MRNLIMIIIVVAMALILGCSRTAKVQDTAQQAAEELTPSVAKRLLDNSLIWKVFVAHERISQGSINCGVKEGLWVLRGPLLGGFVARLTPKGEAAFVGIDIYAYYQQLERGATAGRLSFKSRRRVVEITDIKTSPEAVNSKVVDFTWIIDKDGWPKVLSACLSPPANPRSDSETFVLHGDEWRLAE